jgi:hypothetical protein
VVAIAVQPPAQLAVVAEQADDERLPLKQRYHWIACQQSVLEHRQRKLRPRNVGDDEVVRPQA